MQYEVFFDADVIISGSFSKTGASYQLLLLSELNLIGGVTCERVVEECKRNIEKKLPDAINAFQRIISNALTIVENPTEEEMKKYNGYAHPKDLLVFGAALHHQIGFFVTFNDKHFHPSEKENIQILSPSEMLQKIRADIHPD